MFLNESLELFRYAAQILIFALFAGYILLCAGLAAVLIGKVLVEAITETAKKIIPRFGKSNSKQPEKTAIRREKKLCSG